VSGGKRPRYAHILREDIMRLARDQTRQRHASDVLSVTLGKRLRRSAATIIDDSSSELSRIGGP
jgi:hypothetical protein